MWEKLLQWAIASALASGRWEMVVNEAVKYLAHTVKNPNSADAARLLQGVRLLRDACDNFINAVAGR